jgi:hypothetical protein
MRCTFIHGLDDVLIIKPHWSLARVSRPNTITRVWFYIYPMSQKLPKSGIPHAMTSRWCYADGATTSRRPVQQYAWCHWISPTTLTQQWKSVLHILCCIWYFYATPRYHGSIAGLHGSNTVHCFFFIGCYRLSSLHRVGSCACGLRGGCACIFSLDMHGAHLIPINQTCVGRVVSEFGALYISREILWLSEKSKSLSGKI